MFKNNPFKDMPSADTVKKETMKHKKEVVKGEMEEGKGKVGRKNKRYEPLIYEHKDTDELFVTVIKKLINESNIITQDVYDKFENELDAWNLIYSLRTRKSISNKSFNKWCYVLDVEPEFRFKPIKKQEKDGES